MNDVKQKLEQYILSEFLFGEKSVDPDLDLLNEGIIDSMDVLKLVNFIEDNFGIEVSDADIVPDNFRSLNTLTQYVSSRMVAAQG